MNWVARGLGLYAELITPNRVYKARVAMGLDRNWLGTVVCTIAPTARMRGRVKQMTFAARSEAGAIALVEQWVRQRAERK